MAIVPHDQAPRHSFATSPDPFRERPGTPPAADHRVRSVLAAPRGQRFSRPGASRPTTPRLGPFEPVNTPPETHQARRERLLRQMRGNPRVAYMLEHGELPHWMIVARERREQAEREARENRAARAADEAFLADLPGMVPAKAQGRHRAPRRKRNLSTLAFGVALHSGLAVLAVVGQVVAIAGGFPF
ncbi:hypothetical protein [Nocardiopsis listeri]|uniref:hypothetical protein n=1 Tax=Nocardiopsis listeri TaxID=53440 RepID=UPI000A884D18|nr:hypothetical protein [Nocardiopsis listeri]